MLRLLNTQKPGISYPLLVDTTYTVGRKQGDITFQDDQSVSRVHAHVIVEHPAGNINEPLLTPVLTLQDVGSKFGTFATQDNINSKTPINGRERVTLSVGDKLRFGLQWNEYRVDYTPMVVTSSSFKANQEFKSRIVKLGGHFVNEWNEYVTHLVMESLTLTVKAVCALLAAKPIVTPAYLTEVVSAFETRQTPPGPEGFLPPVQEKGVANLPPSTFQPNTARTTLFAGKTFLFCTSKHMKKVAVAIEAGGGVTKLLTDVIGENILSSEYIIMGHPLDLKDGEKDARIKAVLESYKKGGKRVIPDSEIGLAAVYNSIDKHCNPRCSIVNTVLPHLTTQTQSSPGSSVPLVPETQEVETQGNGGTSINVVNETVIKTEEDEQPDSDTARSSHTNRGEKRSAVDAGSSSSKKRSAEETLTRPGSKRIKEVSSDSPSTSRTTRSSSQKANATKALNSLFNFSSDEDDDEVVPESQPEENDADAEPDSVPLVKVVDVRNLQSVESTQQSVTEQPEPDAEIFRVPASPVMDEPAGDDLRNPGTDFIETVTTSVMNAKTVSLPSRADEASLNRADSKKNSKRSQSSNKTLNESNAPEEGPSRKRRREGSSSSNEANILVAETKKINLNDQVPKTENGEVIPSLPVLKKPLINKNTSRDLSLLGLDESRGSPNGKNFKSFKKVLPSFISGDSSRCQENRNSSRSNDGWVDVSVIDDDANIKPVKMVQYNYWPGETNYRYRRGDIPPPLDPQPERGMDDETPEGFIRFDDTTPQLNAIIARERKKREDEMRKSKEQAKPKAPSPNPEPEPSTSGRRTSPRKKTTAVVKLPVTLPPPSPPKPMQVDLEESEDEDDMWTFNR